MKGQAKKLALQCARIAHAKKGIDVTVLDIRAISQISDYFVIVSGVTDRHGRALAEEIALRSELDLKEFPFRVEGMREGQWVVMDFVDVVVHLFLESSRKYFSLERLWGDAKVVKKYGDHA